MQPKQIVLVVATFATTACSMLTFDCGEGEFRETEGMATVADVSDSIHVGAYVSFNENKAHHDYPARQLVIGVQSVNAPILPPAPAALVGHVPYLHLELASGEVVYRAAVTPAQRDEPTMVGIAVDNNLPAGRFESLRTMLLRNQLFVVLETDNASIVMRKTAVSLESSTGWRKYGCQ